MNTARRFLMALACVAVLSCGTARHTTSRSEMTLVDSLWTFSQSRPEGFTLFLATWEEPVKGISVAYEETQGRHNRSGLEFVISHSQSHEGYVGGWFNSQDSLYYFDSVRLFPEDSLAAAIRFGKAHHQEAIYILSSGKEVRLESVPEN